MEMLEADEFTTYRPKPYFHQEPVSLNSLGCRDDEFNKNADLKILVLGDSVAFGWGVPDYRNTYAEQLQELLAEQEKKNHLTVDVLNAGVPSYKLFQGLQFYQHYLSQIADWDFVIVSFGWNEPMSDDEELEFIRRHPTSESPILRILRTQARRTRTFNVLESSYLRHTATPGGGRDPIVFEMYRKQIKELVEIAGKKNFRLIFLGIQPREDDKGNDAAQAMSRFNKIMQEQVVPGKVLYVDTWQLFEKNRPGYYDEVHFHEDGHRLTARALYEVIARELKL